MPVSTKIHPEGEAMKKEVIWNSFLAALMTAAFAIIGWLSLSVIKLQNQYAAETAEKQLRQDITDVLNDVDKRLAVIEAVVVVRGGEPLHVQRAVVEPEPIPVPVPPDDLPDPPSPGDPAPDQGKPDELRAPFEIPEMQAPPQVPRYDLRDQRIQRPMEDR
jgi:hypothetical protein